MSKHLPLPFRHIRQNPPLVSHIHLLIPILILFILAHQADSTPVFAKSAFLPKKSMLEGQARDLEFIKKSLDENNSQLRGQIQTLASVLPRFISRRAALNGRDFNQASALISKLNQSVGINPYETNPRLVQELQLKRFEFGISASSPGVPRFSFQQVSYLLPGDPLKQGALAPILKERLFPGTFRILIDSDAHFLIYAGDITGQPLRIENSTVFQEGQFN